MATDLPKLAKSVEAAARMGTLGVGGLYVAGLLIVSIHSSAHGVFSVSLVRAEYILVGATWLALTVLVLSTWALMGPSLVRSIRALPSWGAGFRVAWVGLCVIVGTSFPLGAILLLRKWSSG